MCNKETSNTPNLEKGKKKIKNMHYNSFKVTDMRFRIEKQFIIFFNNLIYF